jgi:hypothetical protein
MRARDRGVIVQVGSALAYRGIPLQAPYCGSKHALQGFLESLRCEVLHAKSNVRLTMVQLPALNTPQFTWARGKLPRRPQPVPPIFQPEVGARAVAYVVQHPRRRTAVTWRTSAITVANVLAPRVMDWFVSRTGVSGQQTDKELPVYGDNLDKPVQDDIGAHGSFDDRARSNSPETWANLRIGRVLGAAVSTVTAAGGRTRELLSSR